MADIFREIDEELRRDRALRFWRIYGKYVIAASVGVVVAVGLFIGWRDWQQRERRADGMEFAAAQRLVAEGKTGEAAAAFARLAADAGGGYPLLARLSEAALKIREGDKAAGLAIYQTVADQSGTPKTYRDLAVLLWALNGIDDGEPAVLLSRLAPLARDDSPWRFTALELTALLEHRAGNDARAREIYQRLSDDVETPAPLRARAGEMLAALGGPAKAP